MSAPEHPPTAEHRSRPALPWQAVVAATVLALTAAAMVLVYAGSGDDSGDDPPRATLPLQPIDEGASDRDPLDVEFTDVDGTTGTLRDLVDGRPMVVNFFAEWCTPCVKEMPDFQTVSQRLEGDVDFVGLAVNDRPEDTARIVEETGITYPWTRDIRGDIASAAGVVNMPSTMFIAADGTIEELHTGAVDADRLTALIEEHLGGGPVIEAPLALAFASGMVAAVNPCGFAMLPAYVTFFLGTEGDRVPSKGESVLRAIPVALAVSLGFVAVFGVVGIVLRPLSSTVQEYAPWATIVIGVGLAIFGVLMLRGYEPNARLPKLNRGGRSQGLGSMFLYGVSYAVASLTCTIGIFIANIVNAFSRTDFVSGVAVLVLYAAGMGLVITALTVAIALARDSVVRFMRHGMRHANRAAGALMVAMGLYVAWYGVFSLRVRNDPTAAAGPVDLVEAWSTRANELVDRVGATTLGLYLAGAVVIMVCLSVITSSLRSDAPTPADVTDDRPDDVPDPQPTTTEVPS